jgi:hypothetical protein
MGYLRRNGDDEVLTILNFSKHTIDCVIEDDHVKGIFKNVFTGAPQEIHYNSRFQLQPWDYLVFEKIN